MVAPNYPWNIWFIIAVLAGVTLLAGAVGYLAGH
jgi:hypothetical protein